MSKRGLPHNIFTQQLTVISVGSMDRIMLTHWNSNAITLTSVNASSGQVAQWTNAYTATHFAFGSILCVLFVIGLCEHILVLLVYFRNNAIKTTINTYVVGLVLGDLGQLIFNFPFAILANLYGRWIFGEVLCQYYGFIVTSLGISQIALLTVISVKRYLIIVKHSRTTTNTHSLAKASVLIVLCYLYGSLCAVGPVVGWTRYDVELFGTVCSIRWDNRTPLSLSYVFCLFTFGFFIPLVVIIWSYAHIAVKVYRKRSKALTLKLHDGKTRRRQFRERRVTLTILIMIGMFIVSWSPYAVVSLYTAINGTAGIPHGYFMVPPVIAKTSIIWNPVIYVWRNREFRSALVNTIMMGPMCRRVAKTLKQGVIETTAINLTRRRTDQELCDPDAAKFHRVNGSSDGAEHAQFQRLLCDYACAYDMRVTGTGAAVIVMERSLTEGESNSFSGDSGERL